MFVCDPYYKVSPRDDPMIGGRPHPDANGFAMILQRRLGHNENNQTVCTASEFDYPDRRKPQTWFYQRIPRFDVATSNFDDASRIPRRREDLSRSEIQNVANQIYVGAVAFRNSESVQICICDVAGSRKPNRRNPEAVQFRLSG